MNCPCARIASAISGRGGGIGIVERLRHLDDRVAAVRAEKVKPERFMLGPERPHIAAAVDQDRPVANRRAARAASSKSAIAE